MKILIGTKNKDKFSDYKKFFAAVAPEFEIVSCQDAGITEDAEEKSESLVENAKIKAEFFGKKSGMITIADDVGFFVDALGGEPGVHARRWSQGSDYDRCVGILERMKDVPAGKRTGHYIGVTAVYNPANNKFWTKETRVDGFVPGDFGKEGGFGYDRIVKVPAVDKFYSDLSPEELLKISFRAQGIKGFVESGFSKIK